MTTLHFAAGGEPAFMTAVRQLLRTYRFEPARLADGRKVRQFVQLPFQFAIAKPLGAAHQH